MPCVTGREKACSTGAGDLSLSSAVIDPGSPFGSRTEIPPIGNNTRVHGTAISNIGSPHVLTMPLGEKRESK